MVALMQDPTNMPTAILLFTSPGCYCSMVYDYHTVFGHVLPVGEKKDCKQL